MGLPIAASFEPRAALDGGRDGLDVIRALLERLPDASPTTASRCSRSAAIRDEAPAAAAAVLPGWTATSETDLAVAAGHAGASVTSPAAPAAPPAFPIRLIALDLDARWSTMSWSRERTIAAVRAAVGRGVSVSIVTGRMTTSVLFAHRLGLVDPMVGYQGAIIRAMPAAEDGRLGRLLLHRPLAAAATREAIVYPPRSSSPHVNHLEKFIIGADDPRIDDYSAWFGGRAVRCRTWRRQSSVRSRK